MRAASLIALFLMAFSAGAEPPESQRPTTVAQCVAAAEKDPAHFSSNLRDELQALTGPELIAGLSRTDPRPEIEKRIRPMVYRALCDEGGHTPETAAALFDLAVAVDDAALRGCWLRLLARDRAGNKVLQNFIDGNSDSPLKTEALLAFLRAASEGTSADSPGLNRYADLLWDRYLQARSQESASNPLANSLWEYVRSQPRYHDRLIALVRADVAASRIAKTDEIYLFCESANKDLRLAKELLSWAELPTPPIRRHATACLVGLLPSERLRDPDAPKFEASELVRARHILLRGATEPEQPRRDEIPYHLAPLLDDVDLEDARKVADVSEMHLCKWTRTDTDNLMLVAMQFEELRSRVIAQLLGRNLENAKAVAEGGRLSPRWPEQKWLTKAARDWLRNLKDDDLRDEETQERFLIVVTAARLGSSYRSYSLPPSRYEPPQVSIPNPACDWHASAMKAAEEEQAADLKAFGLPVPEKKLEEPQHAEGYGDQFRRRPIEPLTPAQRTVRWRRFVMARNAIVGLFGVGR